MFTTIIAIFNSRDEVIHALDRLKELGLVDFSKVAVVAKAKSGETIIVNNKLTPIEGRRAGMRLGAIMTALGVAQLGAIALPGIGPLIAIGTGALFGGLVGGATGQVATYLLRFGFRPDQVDTFADRLKEGEVALLMQFETRDQIPQLHAELDKLQAVVLESQASVPGAEDFKQLPSSRLPPDASNDG